MEVLVGSSLSLMLLGAMQNFFGSGVVRQTVLCNVEQDVQVHRDFHLCLFSMC